MKYYAKMWQNYAVFSGRATRAEFWQATLVHLLILLVIVALAFLLDIFAIPPFTAILLNFNLINLANFVHNYAAMLPYILFILISLSPFLALTTRRLHDVDKSGAFWLVAALPIALAYGILFLGVQVNNLDAYWANTLSRGLIISAAVIAVIALPLCVYLIVVLASKGNDEYNEYGRNPARYAKKPPNEKFYTQPHYPKLPQHNQNIQDTQTLQPLQPLQTLPIEQIEQTAPIFEPPPTAPTADTAELKALMQQEEAKITALYTELGKLCYKTIIPTSKTDELYKSINYSLGSLKKYESEIALMASPQPIKTHHVAPPPPPINNDLTFAPQNQADFCTNCYAELQPDYDFCINCGQKTAKEQPPPPPQPPPLPSSPSSPPKKCNYCDAPVRRGLMFCINCGNKIA